MTEARRFAREGVAAQPAAGERMTATHDQYVALDIQVAIVATGGLSHDPGGPKYFAVDEAFDRWFLGLLATGDSERVLREVTIERMMAAGDGGTVELLAWLVAMGAAGERRARTEFYVPSVPLRCGMVGVDWQVRG